METNDPTGIKMEYDPTVQRLRGVTIHGNLPFDVPYISQIKDNLWQGGCRDGLLLPKFFKHVVSLYPWEKYKLKHELDSILVVRMFDDDTKVDIDRVLSIAGWVLSCLKTGPTLVHCQAGLNRSSLVAAFTLMIKDWALTGEDTIDVLRRKRSPACLCNKTFENTVKEWRKGITPENEQE